jgi:DNA-binding response OmpR family regulator
MAKRILIAEDESTTRELLTSLATSQGFDVVAVTNGLDLLSVAAHEHFDIVITDLMMADLDGASATEIMKMQGNTTPVIALTALSVEDLPLIRDKFTRIFQKPVDINELFEYVDLMIRS